MTVRHVTSTDNVDADGFLIDPASACHGSIRLGCLDVVGGPVDPETHLNLDFPDHELGECLVAERLERGAPMARAADGQILRAAPRDDPRAALGRVDLGARRIAWLDLLQQRRNEVADAGG